MIDSFQMTLVPQRAEVSRARRFVVDIVTALGQDHLADVVELLTSELVTNVVLHAGGKRMRITVDWSPPVFRVEVFDESNAKPRQFSYGVEAATGRGLALIEDLASDWGTTPQADGKSVWFEVDAAA